MKRKLIRALLAGVLVAGLTTAAAFAEVQTIKIFYNGTEIKADRTPINLNGRILAPVRALAEAMGATVTWDQASNQVNITNNSQDARITNLERALTPKTAAEAVNAWAEGVKTRNGAWQYAVMTPELKKASYEEFAAMGWSTGTSSPWVLNVAISELEKTDDSTYHYAVKFTWTDSTNSTFETTQRITVKNMDGSWFVDAVEDPAAQ